MAQLLVTAEEVSVIKLVGPGTFRQARELVERGQVLRRPSDGDPDLLLGEIVPASGSGSEPIFATVSITEGRSGMVVDLTTSCSAGCALLCAHSVAVALTEISPPAPRRGTPVAKPKAEVVPGWQRALAPFLAVPVAEAPVQAPVVGLQFELVTRTATRYDRSPGSVVNRLACGR